MGRFDRKFCRKRSDICVMKRPPQKPIAMEAAPLDWQAGRTPVSTRFDDIYFSCEDGLAESRFVFLDGVGGAQNLFGAQVSILETGFGAGLNFLMTCAAWTEWLKTQPMDNPARLTFVSVEAYPLSRDDLAAALAPWAELAEGAQALIAAYPQLYRGTHVLDFGQVRLILLFGEVTEVLPQCRGPFDAIYMDGFAPAKNPQMWCDAVYQQLARLSRRGTRLATFTAAGQVRRGLTEVGFTLHKAPGFGRKRERLVGVFGDVLPPSYALPQTRVHPGGRVAVIGAGIAGNSTAFHLHRAGFQIDLYDRADGIAAGASGNPAAIFEPTLLNEKSPLGDFLREAFLYAEAFYHDLSQTHPGLWAVRCGSLHLPKDDADCQRTATAAAHPSLPRDRYRLVTKDEASALCGRAVADGGLWYDRAACLDPLALARALTEDVSFHGGCAVHRLEKQRGRWILYDKGAAVLGAADAVVICTGYDAVHFAQTHRFPLNRNKGQVTMIPVVPEAQHQRAIISGQCYLSPPLSVAGQSYQVLGASYARWGDDNPESWRRTTRDCQQDNLNRLGRHFPEWQQALAAQPAACFSDRASLRATVADRFAIAGPVPRLDIEDSQIRGLSPTGEALSYHDGLFCSVGHGSRGFVTAPIVAAMVTALLSGQSLPLSADQVARLHPGRFALRQRGKV